MNDTAPDKQHSLIKKVVFSAITAGVILLLFEVLSSTVLLYKYRHAKNGSALFQEEVSNYSAINLIYRFAVDAGIYTYSKFGKETQPDPFYRPDSRLGYSAFPGTFVHTYLHRTSPRSDWRSLKIKVTVNEDGTRWTGNTEQGAKPSVYIFGDSFVFGTGVNDEHTFAYLLQQARPDLKVKLFALGGYGLAQAYLRFNDIKDSLKPDDIIVLGYADFYDVRNVVAPSWLQEKRDWIAEKNPSKENESSNLLPSASLVDGKIGIAYIQENCLHNGGYCESTDPDRLEMTKVSAALINYIAHNTLAKVYLLHFHGNAENPVFQQVNGVTHISALPGDFDYFIQDDIEGFDPHPGPFWHYAISRKLIQVLSSN